MRTVCINCGQPRPKTTACPHCHAPTQQQIRAARSTRAWQQHSAALIATEPWCHNPDCPHPDAGTPTNPLTADHTQALALGGTLHGPTQPTCRRCNSSRKTG